MEPQILSNGPEFRAILGGRQAGSGFFERNSTSQSPFCPACAPTRQSNASSACFPCRSRTQRCRVATTSAAPMRKIGAAFPSPNGSRDLSSSQKRWVTLSRVRSAFGRSVSSRFNLRHRLSNSRFRSSIFSVLIDKPIAWAWPPKRQFLNASQLGLQVETRDAAA